MKAFTLLAVDDEIHNLKSIERTLRGEKQLKVLSCSSAEQALEVVQRQTIHIVVTDQRMPGMNGTDLLNRLVEISPNTVRIILTAYTEVDEILQAINRGHVYGYLIKPWNAEELRTVIQQAKQYYRLRETNRRLTEELQEKNRQLSQKNEELKKFNELKTRFMVVASHELRTPATIISGALELLEDNREQLPPTLQKLLKNAINGASRLNEIIETFFESVKWDGDGRVLSPITVELAPLIRLVADRFSPFIKERRVNFDFQLDNSIQVMGDRRKLFLVLENLLSNAIKYTPDGGSITVCLHREDGLAIIRVQDTGIGIPKEELQNIFDTFYQLENVKHHHSSRYAFMGGGTGLGLSLCRSIIQAHRGKIWAESKGTQKGSTFYVQLPLRKT